MICLAPCYFFILHRFESDQRENSLAGREIGRGGLVVELVEHASAKERLEEVPLVCEFGCRQLCARGRLDHDCGVEALQPDDGRTTVRMR